MSTKQMLLYGFGAVFIVAAGWFIYADRTGAIVATTPAATIKK